MLFLCSLFPYVWPYARQICAVPGSQPQGHKVSLFPGARSQVASCDLNWQRSEGGERVICKLRTQEVSLKRHILCLNTEDSAAFLELPQGQEPMSYVPTTEGNDEGVSDWENTVFTCLVRDWHTSYSWFNNCRAKLPISEPNPGKVKEIVWWVRKNSDCFLGGIFVVVVVIGL